MLSPVVRQLVSVPCSILGTSRKIVIVELRPECFRRCGILGGTDIFGSVHSKCMDMFGPSLIMFTVLLSMEPALSISFHDCS